MIPDTALNSYLRMLTEKSGRDMDVRRADFFANGWGIHYRNSPDRRHIRMSRGRMTWQETTTMKRSKSSITITGIAVPDTLLVEKNLHGRAITDMIALPEDVLPFLSGAVICGSKATSIGYIPIPIIVLEYDKE